MWLAGQQALHSGTKFRRRPIIGELGHTRAIPPQTVAHGAQLPFESLAPGTLGNVTENDFAEGRSGSFGVELAIHVGVEVQATREAVSGQGE